MSDSGVPMGECFHGDQFQEDCIGCWRADARIAHALALGADKRAEKAEAEVERLRAEIELAKQTLLLVGDTGGKIALELGEENARLRQRLAELEAERDDKPQFTHDCERCVFLGRMHRDEKPFCGDYDLYWCFQKGVPTVIARYGDDGPQYSSGLPLANGIDPILAEAKRRAVARGFACGAVTKGAGA